MSKKQNSLRKEHSHAFGVKVVGKIPKAGFLSFFNTKSLLFLLFSGFLG